MTKTQLINQIKLLIEPDTTPDPDEFTDGAVLDLIYALVTTEEGAE